MSDAALAAGAGRHRLGRRLLTPWTLVAGIPLVVAVVDPAHAAAFVAMAARSFLATAPYIAIAVALIAGLKATGAEATLATAFEGRERRMIVLAGLLGGLAPFCSCEVVPFIAGLLAVGAPLSAIMAFWLSSPLIDPPTLFITAAALGWPFALAKALAAVALGLFGGFAVKALTAGGMFADPLRPRRGGGCGCGPTPFAGRPVWRFWTEPERRDVFADALAVNALFLVKWLALAYVLEALLISYVPASIVAGAVGGDGLVPIVAGALVGMPAYLNSYVAPPLVAGTMAQGMSAGAAMAFMVAGAVSSVPAMAAVWSLVRPAVFAVYLGLGFVGAVLAGIVYGMLT